MLRKIPFIAIVLLVAGCAGLTPRDTTETFYVHDYPAAESCLGTLNTIDRLVLEKGVQNASSSKIPGFPFLRVNRFLSSFRNELDNRAKNHQWLEAMARLDNEARYSEIMNISVEALGTVIPGFTARQELLDQIQICNSLLVELTIEAPKAIQLIKTRAVVADDYSIAKRTIGIYPLTSLFFMSGIKNLHQETRKRFSVPIDKRLQKGNYLLYQVADSENNISKLDPKEILSSSADNPLGIPEPGSSELDKLFEYYAPVWEIETEDNYDLPGIPYLQSNEVRINTQQHITYTYHSFTRFYKGIKLQLNYVIWFPARPLTGPFDLLGGHLDGITWRITLSSDGDVLFYDTIHNCGCYHIAFPDEQFHKIKESSELTEPILVPVNAPDIKDGQRLVVTLNSGTHYLSHIRAMTVNEMDKQYILEEYSHLKLLSSNTQGIRAKSMFDKDGLVSGTERKERWLFWPMGIDEPGAMRQRGRHAIAFVGRRHFDDPFIFEKNFIYNNKQ